jgi:hypothetical protein
MKYEYGDRVFSKFSGVPLIGMVIRETEDGVLVHADLPIALESGLRYVVNVPKKITKKLKVFE